MKKSFLAIVGRLAGKHAFIAAMLTAVVMLFVLNASPVWAQDDAPAADSAVVAATPDSLLSADADESLWEEAMLTAADNGNMYKVLKRKFIEGNAMFMSLVTLALILGLTLCIERIIFLSLSEIDTRKFVGEVKKNLEDGDVEMALSRCAETQGPVAAVCRHALEHADEPMDDVERSVVSYGTLQASMLEKGCSWIKLFIAMAPSLGFLGTVIGMVMAFDQIQEAGDISPTIVASGMKVALITTIFGIIVALVLQVFYNFILSKIERLTGQMEESAIELMDAMTKMKNKG